MVRQVLDLWEWRWRVNVYYVTQRGDSGEILRKMRSIGASRAELLKAARTLDTDALNCGMTYSNFRSRRSVVAIGRAENAEEFASTYDHEKGHLTVHIAEADGIDLYGEEFQYLAGETGRQMFRVARQFLCDCCRSGRQPLSLR